MMCKIDHDDPMALPAILCRECHPELNQIVIAKAEPKKKRVKWKRERMVTTVIEEADARWRNWLPTKEDRKRPTRRQLAKTVREERGMS